MLIHVMVMNLCNISRQTGSSIKKKLGITVHSDKDSLDLFRGIRSQIAALLDGLDPKDLATMSLGLSHSLSRYVNTV